MRDLALSGDHGLEIVRGFRAGLAGMQGGLAVNRSRGYAPRAMELGALSLVDAYDLRHVEDWLLYGLDPEDHPLRALIRGNRSTNTPSA